MERDLMLENAADSESATPQNLLINGSGLNIQYQERPSDSTFIEKIWRTHSELDDRFIAAADGRWDMMILRQDGKATAMITGPLTKAMPIPHVAGAEWLGIQFKLGVVMPHLPANNLVDEGVRLPEGAGKSFWLHGSVWQLPDYDNVDTFIDRLLRADLLTHDGVVESVLQGQSPAWSPRSVQYRFSRTTGLTHKVIQQIERAHQARALLAQGISILDTAHQLGYFDQAHLTNSLKRFIGRTPAQIARLPRPE